jgi:hypothetical protein
MKTTMIDAYLFSGKAKEIAMRQAYAVFWIDSNGRTGNGGYNLNEHALRRWLSDLRYRYPDMQHWGQLPNGDRYVEIPPVPVHEPPPVGTIHGVVG